MAISTVAPVAAREIGSLKTQKTSNTPGCLTFFGKMINVDK